MPLSTEEILTVKKMHDFVRYFENKRPWVIGLLCVGSALTLVAATLIAKVALRSTSLEMSKTTVAVIIGFLVGMYFAFIVNFFAQSDRYRENLATLKTLTREHGDQIPEIRLEMEGRQLAAR